MLFDQRSTGKPSDINFSGRPKKQKKYQNAKMCWKKKMPRDMKILAIYPSTRGLQPTRKCSYTHFSVFPQNHKAWFRGQIVFSGPWSTVPKANFVLGTMEHGPEGKYSPRDLVPRKKVWKWVKKPGIGPKWTKTCLPLTKNLMRK